MKFSNKIGLAILAVFLFLFYRFFISTSPIVGHDWPLLFRESRSFFPFWSISWDYMGGIGIGGPAFKTIWIDLYANSVYAISNLINLPWWISQRLFWILLFVLLSLFSSYKFAGLFIKESLFRVLSSITYSFNTYILLIVGGGQFGIAFAYALSPIVIKSFVNSFEEKIFKDKVLSGILLSVLIIADPRIAVLITTLVILLRVFLIKDFRIKELNFLFVPFLLAFLINSYWILPVLLTKGSSLNFENYTSLLGVKFLSFASFSNSLSLLHPNWPDNIFGKTYFMRVEFIILPILAYSSLFFLNMSKVKNTSKKSKTQVKSQNFSNLAIEQFSNRAILFFAILGLLGAFLGKGVNDPFGQVYSFLFQSIPGFNLFRDSTKFFILIALSYSILIPYFFERLPRFKYILILIFILYWLSILKPAWNGELTGIFKPKQIPQEYLLLKKKIKNDAFFYRTLWLPQRQKYGYFDPKHPAVDGSSLFSNNNVEFIKKNFDKSDLKNNLSNLSIKYVIVPYDSDKEIFLKDRRYDDRNYQETVSKLSKISWLKRIVGFGKIVVFEVPNSRDHFWIESRITNHESGVVYEQQNPTKYLVNINNAKKGDVLVFSEGFDKNWQASFSNLSIGSKTFNGLNSFILPRDGSLELEVFYAPQKHVEAGLWLSGLTFLGTLSYLVFGRKAKKW